MSDVQEVQAEIKSLDEETLGYSANTFLAVIKGVILKNGLHAGLDAIEKCIVADAAERFYNRSEAARYIGVNRSTFTMMLKKHGLFIFRGPKRNFPLPEHNK